MKAHTYLNFPNGKTEEAFLFYADAFGSELEMLTRFEDMPVPGFELPAEAAKRIMHVRLPLGDGSGDQVLMPVSISPGDLAVEGDDLE